MKMNRNMACATFVALATLIIASNSEGAVIPVSDWVVHNGTVDAITDGETNSPTFTPADAITVMAPFPAITLANDGDYIKLTTTLSMFGRTTTGVNTLNNHLRFGLFNGPDGVVALEDTPNLGIVAMYANENQNSLRVFEQSNAGQNDPMGAGLGGALANGNQVVVDDSIQGADPTANYEMTLTRVGGELRIEAQISGGDYLSALDLGGHSSATFPSGGEFSFNRVGFFLGDNVNAAGGATFANVTIETNVPEPSSLMLMAMMAIGALAYGGRK